MAVLLSALLGLSACAAAVNWGALRGWYYARVPIDQLAARAALAGEDRRLLELAAKRLLEADRPAEARELLEAHVATLGDQAGYRVLLGRACLETGALKEAYAHLMVALLADARHPDAHWWLAETLRQSDQPAEAVGHYRRVTELDPRRGDAWLRLAAAAFEESHYERALELLERAEATLPTGEGARLRAQALRKLGRLEESVAAAREALARAPGAASRLILGQLLALSADPVHWREAQAHLRQVVDTEPRNDEARRELGLVCRQLGDHREAVRQLRAHLRLNPGATRSYPVLAQSYQALGKSALAEQVLRIYRRLEPIEMKAAQAEYSTAALKGGIETRLALARAYAECGFEDHAQRELEGLLRLRPGYEPAVKLLARLPRRRSLGIPPLPPDPEGDR